MKNSFKKTPNFDIFTYSSLIRLPDIYKTQIQTGFLFSTKKRDLNIGGTIVLQRRFEVPKIGIFETKGIITLSKQQNSLGFQLVKDFKIGYIRNKIHNKLIFSTGQLNLNFRKNGNNFEMNPNISFTKQITDELASKQLKKIQIFLVNISNSGIGDININPNYIHEFKNAKIKWKIEPSISSDSFEFLTNITKEINPKVFVFAVKF